MPLHGCQLAVHATHLANAQLSIIRWMAVDISVLDVIAQ
jgi:hypothetical protein